MSTSNELHNASMDLAEAALVARLRRDHETAHRLFRESLDLELAALDAIDPLSQVEPTTSVLRRSAATLALDCNEPRVAERLVARALVDDPPGQIGEELRDLMEQVHFQRHLQLRGVSLADDELQMSLAGQGVGFGVVHSAAFLQRVDDTSKMIYRIAERRRNMPFRERGRMKKSVSDDFEFFLSVPRAASFAVTMKLGTPTDQQRLPGVLDTAEIVDEFMDLMAFVDRADYKSIDERIPDVAYRTNFVQLAKRVVPDGSDVRIVGFTALRAGRERFVEVTRRKGDVLPPEVGAVQPEQQPESVTICGILKFADATHGESGQIRIVDENTGAIHQVKVPEGMMNDIVKPLWDNLVVVTGVREGKYIRLEDIDEQEA